MKKNRIFLFLVFQLFGLSIWGISGTISLEKARNVAQNWLTHCVRAYHGWGGTIEPQIVGEEVVIYLHHVVGYNFIVFPVGSILVPSRDELPPIKLYSDTSTLVIAQNSDIVQWICDELYKINRALNDHAHEMAGIDFTQTSNGKLWALFQADSTSFAVEYERAIEGYELLSLGPLLESFWNQYEPYNIYCPEGDGGTTLVGCVATAVAQIMRYFQWPASGIGNHSYPWDGDQSCRGSTSGQNLEAIFSDTYDWANMLNSYNGTYTLAQARAAAELCYEVGVALETDYGRCISEAYLQDAVIVLYRYFRYKASTIDCIYRSEYANDHEWMLVFKTEVENRRPLLMRIRDPNYDLQHLVVVDGYQNSPLEQIHIKMGWKEESYDWWYSTNNIVMGEYNWSDVNFQAAAIGIAPDYPLTCPDINQDHAVDIGDLIMIATHFGCERGAPNWDPTVDCNQDGIIDIFDVVFVATRFN